MASATKQVTWKDFGRFLGLMRRQRGHSRERLAKILGCDRTTIYRLETGKTKPSRLFLHNMLRTYPLTRVEAEQITEFSQLRETQCDALPIEVERWE